MAVWMPVTVVPRSLATDRMETFMTEVSRVMRNCAEASTRRTNDPVREAGPSAVASEGTVGLALNGPTRSGRWASSDDQG